MHAYLHEILMKKLSFCIFRLFQTDSCKSKRRFICQQPANYVEEIRSCPFKFRLYKNKCIYDGFASGRTKYNMSEAMKQCAARGSIVLPIKNEAMYNFVRIWAVAEKLGDLFLGMNFSSSLPNPIYTDRTSFIRNQSFQFGVDSDKFGDKDCAYLKKGVSFKPRSADCSTPMNFLCLWNSKCNLHVSFNFTLSVLARAFLSFWIYSLC